MFPIMTPTEQVSLEPAPPSPLLFNSIRLVTKKKDPRKLKTVRGPVTGRVIIRERRRISGPGKGQWYRSLVVSLRRVVVDLLPGQ